MLKLFTLIAINIASWHPMERATYYNADPSQCQGDHLTTASGQRIDPDNVQRWVALSRDQLTRWGGSFSYGDTILVIGDERLKGEWVVQDCMNARYKRSIDFLLPMGGMKIGVLTTIKIKKK
jgi:hypothetical protein